VRDGHQSRGLGLARLGLLGVAITTAIEIVLIGCTGTIGGPNDGLGGIAGGSGSGMSSSGGGAATGSVAGGGSGLSAAQSVFVPQASSLRRLTIPQYQNSIHDLLGASIAVPTDFEEDTSLSGFASIGAATVGLSAHIVEQFETASLDIAKQALSNMTTRGALVGCTPAAVTDDVCTRQFIQAIGRRAWRRPVSDAEVGQYAGVAKNAQTVLNDFYGGLQYALAGILQSPHFLYREELGTPDPAVPARVVFNDHELATRLSFFLWNTTPDDQLLAAADAQQLTHGGGLGTQATRLSSSDRVVSAMQTFFTELYRLGELDSMLKLATVYPQMTPTLGPSMRAETLHFLSDIAFTHEGDFRQIFDARQTFVNKELAALYGLPAPATDWAATPLADSTMRAGLLGQASFLALNAQPNRSSATRRGKFIREMLLCQTISAPPPNVAPFPEAVPGTTRTKLTAHRQSPACNSCHQMMDPIGLALENFDGMGVFRATDQGLPIDASGDLDGTSFTGPLGLATALRNNPNSTACVARNVYRYAVAHIDNDGEQVAIAELAKAFQANGYRFRSLLAAIVNSPGFVYAAKAN
jgi:hypothetical protein